MTFRYFISNICLQVIVGWVINDLLCQSKYSMSKRINTSNKKTLKIKEVIGMTIPKKASNKIEMKQTHIKFLT